MSLNITRHTRVSVDLHNSASQTTDNPACDVVEIYISILPAHNFPCSRSLHRGNYGAVIPFAFFAVYKERKKEEIKFPLFSLYALSPISNSLASKSVFSRV